MPDLSPHTGYDDLFCKPVARLNDWIFDDNVAGVFQNMIQRSVPGYATVISMTGILAERFVQPYSQIYDLGCSLGASTLAVHNNICVPGCKIIAIDNSPAMIARCREHLAALHMTTPVELIETSILDIKLENASMIVLNFTLQFLEPACRQHLMNQIYAALLPGGVLILSEKFHFHDDQINELLYNMHHDFKRANGYSSLEINQKRSMLEKVMRTDSVEIHKKRLHKAGFEHSEVWFQYLNFGSLLALKAKKPA